jgi:hypothetical protein
MTKLHQLKPPASPEAKKPEPGEGGGGTGGAGTPELPNTRTLQITLSQPTHVLIVRLGALYLERGARMSATSKSAVIEAAIRALAKTEGLL